MAGSRFAVLVDGFRAYAGVKSVDGGSVRALVTADSSVGGLRPRKRISTLTSEPLVVQTGLHRTEGLLSWIRESLEHGPVLKSGEVHLVDDEYRSLSERQFFSGVIREVVIPACDAKSKDVIHVTLTIEPQGLRAKTGGGENLKVLEGDKQWLASNFRVSIDGLPCEKVIKVDTLVWKQSRTSAEGGATREPADWVMEVPNVKLTMPMSEWDPWSTWVEAFLFGGNSSSAIERNGQVEFLAPDLQETLATIELIGLGPIVATPDLSEAQGDRIMTFTVEMYCQDMRFAQGQGERQPNETRVRRIDAERLPRH